MHWPAKASISPKYISPSTQSVIISVNPQATPAGATTFSNISSASGNPPTTTVAIPAPLGSDTFLIQLYDQQQIAGETAPAGNLLGETQITQTINPGVVNSISATINGVISSISVTARANQPTVESSGNSEYTIVGTTPVLFDVAPLDADGNVIVGPGTVPSITLTPSNNSVAVTPETGVPNEFSVQAVAASGNNPPSLTASATDASGDTANSLILLNPVSAIYAGYNAGGLLLFDPSGNAISLPSGAFSGVQHPAALAFDYDDNEIFVADTSQNKILAFDALGNAVSPFSAPTVTGITGVTYDSNNKTIYATGSSGISAFTVVGAPTGTPISLSNAVGIAFVPFDNSGNALNQLAVATAGASPSVAFYSESGSSVSSFPLSGAPSAIAYCQRSGSLQKLYIVRTSGNIDGFDLQGNNQISMSDTNAPFSVAIDPNRQEPYVSEQATNNIVPYLPDLSGSDTAIATLAPPAGSGLTTPAGIAIAY